MEGLKDSAPRLTLPEREQFVGERGAVERPPVPLFQMDPEEETGGYHWRKYGEKTVAAKKAALKRSYYRCASSRTTNSCPAKKRVDRLVHDGAEAAPISVTYINAHNHAPKPTLQDGAFQHFPGADPASHGEGSNIPELRRGLENLSAEDLAMEMYTDLQLQMQMQVQMQGQQASAGPGEALSPSQQAGVRAAPPCWEKVLDVAGGKPEGSREEQVSGGEAWVEGESMAGRALQQHIQGSGGSWKERASFAVPKSHNQMLATAGSWKDGGSVVSGEGSPVWGKRTREMPEGRGETIIMRTVSEGDVAFKTFMGPQGGPLVLGQAGLGSHGGLNKLEGGVVGTPERAHWLGERMVGSPGGAQKLGEAPAMKVLAWLKEARNMMSSQAMSDDCMPALKTPRIIGQNSVGGSDATLSETAECTEGMAAEVGSAAATTTSGGSGEETPVEGSEGTELLDGNIAALSPPGTPRETAVHSFAVPRAAVPQNHYSSEPNTPVGQAALLRSGCSYDMSSLCISAPPSGKSSSLEHPALPHAGRGSSGWQPAHSSTLLYCSAPVHVSQSSPHLSSSPASASAASGSLTSSSPGAFQQSAKPHSVQSCGGDLSQFYAPAGAASLQETPSIDDLTVTVEDYAQLDPYPFSFAVPSL